ncbi:MAG: orotidine-5'-phosphate decarboxylase [Thermodesulfobacteriota bacterium]
MPGISPKDRIILPLDVPTTGEALSLVKTLKEHVGVFKIGLELFVGEGPDVVTRVKAEAPDAKIFLDMKFHDIPATVRGAMNSAAGLGVDFVTVHCDSPALLEAVVGAGSRELKVLGVTVLTSLSQNDLEEVAPRLRLPEALVLHRANLANEAGCAGIVCSGLEVKLVKEAFGPDFIAVTPGIRFSEEKEDKKDDQKRVVSPYEAVRDGADYIVVGRPIRQAPDPREAAERVAKEIQRALSEIG